MATLDDDTADAARRLVAEGRTSELEGLVVDESTLGAAAELACATFFWGRDGNTTAVDAIQRWASGNLRLARAIACVGGARQSDIARHAAPRTQIEPVSADPDEIPFLSERFKRSLVEHGGYAKPLATAVSGALGEMTDNVLRHSTEREGTPAPAVVGYAVSGSEFEFVVADAGRGALASLRTIAVWTELVDAKMALDAIVTRGATRRSGHSVGGGFRDLFTALVDLAGELRVRSDDAAVTLDGRGDSSRRIKVDASVPWLPGFQVTVRGRR